MELVHDTNPPQITHSTRGFFASGGLVYGVVQNAHYFVLVYYSQVQGLSAELAGLAIGIGQYKVTPQKAPCVPLRIG